MSEVTKPLFKDETGQDVVRVLGEIRNAIGGTDTKKTYGFIEHMDVLAPGSRIEYIGANKTFDPISIDKSAHTYDLGEWANFEWLEKNKPYMVHSNGVADYALNPKDYTKKADGTASDVANASYDGGAFAWAQKIYKRETTSGDKRKVEFSMVKQDGFEPVGFIGKDGNELEGKWIPMFYASVANNKATCISGTQPSASLTTDAQKTAVEAFGDRANFLGGPFVETLIDLMILFAKTTDLQGFYGNGNMSGYVNDSTKYYGVLANAVVGGGQFYGTTDGKSLNKIFHSVVLGTYQQWMRDPYEICVNGKVKVSKDYSIDLTGVSYTDTGITAVAASAAYYDKLKTVDGYGAVPVAPYSGTSATGVCDAIWVNVTIVAVCLRFGNANNGLNDGPRARNWNNTASNATWSLGFAVLLDSPVNTAPAV